jgi:hypothetical protein
MATRPTSEPRATPSHKARTAGLRGQYGLNRSGGGGTTSRSSRSQLTSTRTPTMPGIVGTIRSRPATVRARSSYANPVSLQSGIRQAEPGDLGEVALAHRQRLVVLLGRSLRAEPRERLAIGKMPTTSLPRARRLRTPNRRTPGAAVLRLVAGKGVAGGPTTTSYAEAPARSNPTITAGISLALIVRGPRCLTARGREACQACALAN